MEREKTTEMRSNRGANKEVVEAEVERERYRATGVPPCHVGEEYV